MKEEIRKDYLKRLFIPYRKRNECKSFIYQYLQGSGNELKKKFWSTSSSSRLCFDLYSWMASDKRFIDFEFEKKLESIISGNRRVFANMDVYFETKDGIYFIESKYTETTNNSFYNQTLPQAYWKEDNVYLNVKGKEVPGSILDRYNNEAVVKDEFVKFIAEIGNLAVQENCASWFDAKQETCHLLGIVFYAIKNTPQKPIHFFNISVNYKRNDGFAELFRSKAEEMMKRILNEKSVQFDYQFYSVRDFFNKNQYLEQKGYQTERTVFELVSDKNLYKDQSIL